jgi:hypothetical protein
MAASTSGSGSDARSPNRPGWSTAAPRPASLTARARSRAAASSPKWTPGDEIESSDVAIPSRSIAATCSSADHSGTAGKPSGRAWPAATTASR